LRKTLDHGTFPDGVRKIRIAGTSSAVTFGNLHAKNFGDSLKYWGECISPWVTLLGIIAAAYTYYQWEVGRDDHAVDFLLRLDEKFDSGEVEQGRNLVDWDEEYNEVKDRLAVRADPVRLKQETEMVRKKQAEPDSPERTAFLTAYAAVTAKVTEIDAYLGFYETLDVMRQAKQAPARWMRIRFSDWLDYYYDDNRKELRAYIDTYYPALSAWLKEDQSENPENRYFSPHHLMASPAP
jgi:hypothetical protein